MTNRSISEISPVRAPTFGSAAARRRFSVDTAPADGLFGRNGLHRKSGSKLPHSKGRYRLHCENAKNRSLALLGMTMEEKQERTARRGARPLHDLQTCPSKTSISQGNNQICRRADNFHPANSFPRSSQSLCPLCSGLCDLCVTVPLSSSLAAGCKLSTVGWRLLCSPKSNHSRTSSPIARKSNCSRTYAKQGVGGPFQQNASFP